MAMLAILGFELGTVDESGTVNGTGSIQTSVVHSGTYAYRCNPTTTGTGGVQIPVRDTSGLGGGAGLPASNQDVYVRFWFRYATKPATNQEPILRILGSVSEGNPGHFDVGINSSGQLTAHQGNVNGATHTLLATGTTALLANTWYRIEAKRLAGTTSNWEVKINGTSEISGSQNWPVTTSNQPPIIGKTVNWNGNSVDFFYDDVAVSNSAYPGNGQGLLLLPNANGTYQTATIGAGSGSHFQVVDEFPQNGDTDYLLTSAVNNDAETIAMSDTASAGITGTINGVNSIAYFCGDTGNNNIKLRLRSGSTDSDGTINGNIQSTYALWSRFFATDPATGLAWTTGGVDGIEVGIVNQTTTKSRFTMCAIYVDYTAGDAQDTPELYERCDTQMQQLLAR